MKRTVCLSLATLGLAGALLPAALAAQPANPVTLSIFAAGTLAVPFRQVNALFEKKYPNVTVQAQFGGSVMMAKKITDLHQDADLLAVADYNVIPKYMFGNPAHASWYAGFARNAITFVYTDKSKFANEINPQNWYKVLARPGVEIGRSNPDTDPSGYQTVQMLNLAEKFYNEPGLEQKILANAPLTNMRDTETSLISALQLGQIDYLAIYRSDALQHHLKFIDLPAKIDLSDPAQSAYYQKRRRPHQEWRPRRQADRLRGYRGQRQQECDDGGELRRPPARTARPSRHEDERLWHIQSGLCGARGRNACTA